MRSVRSRQHLPYLDDRRKQRRLQPGRRRATVACRRLAVERLEDRRMLDAAAVIPQIIYHEDFEAGDGGYQADNTGRTMNGLWHYSVGRRDDQLGNHTPIHNWYYGTFESSTGGGHYIIGGDHRGLLVSPHTIDIPSCGTSELRFSSFLDTRDELDVDFVEVWIYDGASTTTVSSRQAGTLPETDREATEWNTGLVDLTPFAGRRIQLQFLFDTGPMPLVDPEGWYVDDIWITNICAPQETDLAIDKRDDGSNAVAGTDYTYTLEVTNLGPSDSSGATVTDTLPAEWHFDSSSNASCSGNGANPETVTCTVGPLVSGAAR